VGEACTHICTRTWTWTHKWTLTTYILYILALVYLCTRSSTHTRIGTPGKKLDWEEGRELGCPKLTYFNYLRFNTGAAKIIDLATVKSFLSTYKIIFSTCLHIPIIQPVRKRNTKKSILLYRIHWYMVFLQFWKSGLSESCLWIPWTKIDQEFL
jgi:hypothetical protein